MKKKLLFFKEKTIKQKLILLSTILLGAITSLNAQTPISVTNADLTLPGAGPVEGWDTPTDIPGWFSDIDLTNNGLSQYAAEGVADNGTTNLGKVRYGEPVYNITSHVIASGQSFSLTVDLVNLWYGDVIDIKLYYADLNDGTGARTYLKTQTCNVNAEYGWRNWGEYTMVLSSGSVPGGAVGKYLGIEIENKSYQALPNDGWAGFDNVSLTYDTVSSDATLSAITLSTGTLVPTFASGTTFYRVTLPNGTSSVDVGATATDGGAVINSGTGTINLVSGYATTDIMVTAENGVTTKTYTVEFIEECFTRKYPSGNLCANPTFYGTAASQYGFSYSWTNFDTKSTEDACSVGTTTGSLYLKGTCYPDGGVIEFNSGVPIVAGKVYRILVQVKNETAATGAFNLAFPNSVWNLTDNDNNWPDQFIKGIPNGSGWVQFDQVIKAGPSATGNVSFNIHSCDGFVGSALSDFLYVDNLQVYALDDVNEWTGATNNLFSEATNWSTGFVPNSNEVVLIDSGDVILDQDFTAAENLTISGTGTLTVNPTRTLTVTGTADFGSKSVTFESDATGTARFGALTGALHDASNVTSERYVPARRAYRFVSSPVTTSTTIDQNWQQDTHITGTGGATNGFDATGTNNPSMFTHDNAGAAWVAVDNTNVNTLTAGTPYRLMVRGDRTISLATNTPTPTNTTLRATGSLAIGTHDVLDLNANASAFNFIGNPYQAAVNMQAVVGAATNITNFYYVWDPTLATRGAYVTRDLSGLGSNNVTSDVDNYLQPGQACFVQTNATAATALSFTEANKYTAATNESVWRLAEAKETTSSLHVTLKSNGTIVDGTLVKFDSENSNDVDGNDAGKLTNLDENMATKTNGKLLSIERKALPTKDDEIQLDITKYRSTDYTLEVEGENIEGVTAFLCDKLTQTYTEIPASGSISYDYSVDANDNASVASDRLKIVFADKSSSEELSVNEFTLYPNPSKGGEFTVTLTNSSDESVISIIDLAGRLVYSVTVEAGTATYNVEPNQPLAPGVYFVKLAQGGKTVIKKLIVK